MEENIMLATVTQLAANNKKTNKNKNQNVEVAEEVVDTQATTEVQTTDNQTDANKLNLDWQNPSWDLFLIAFFAIGALLYGVSLGKDRIIAILVSIYMALAVVNSLPDFVMNVKLNENFTLQITAFVSIFVVLFFLLSRSAILNAIDTSQQGKWYQVIIFSVLHVGLLVSVAMSFMPEIFVHKFADITQLIFTHEWAQFGWIIAPIVAMIIFGRREE